MNKRTERYSKRRAAFSEKDDNDIESPDIDAVKNVRLSRRLDPTSRPRSGRPVRSRSGGDSAHRQNRQNKKNSYEKDVQIPVVYTETDRFVLPGERISTIEEFSAGPGVSVVSGDLLSLFAGNVAVNESKRMISVVSSARTPNILCENDVVYGQITSIRDTSAYVDIVATEKMPDSEIVNNGNAEIYVSNVQNGFTKTIGDEFSTLDIVRARVIDSRKIDLSTVGDDFGVIKAYCSRCRTDLEKKDNYLECPSCHNKEKRKTASGYGKGMPV